MSERLRGDPDGRLKRARQTRNSDPKSIAAASESERQSWQDPEIRARRLAGYTPEVRQRMSEHHKAVWAALPAEEKQARIRKMHAKVRGGHYLSSLEAAVCQRLNELDLAYQIHKPVGSYVADVLVPSLLLDIECDGVYWHSSEARTASDEQRDQAFAAAGYRVLRITEPPTIDELRSAVLA